MLTIEAGGATNARICAWHYTVAKHISYRTTKQYDRSPVLARHNDIEHLQSSDRRELFLTATKAGIQAVNITDSQPSTGSVVLSYPYILCIQQFLCGSKTL